MSALHLAPCTRALWHTIRRQYVPDPMMDNSPYTYDPARAEALWQTRGQDPTRRYFAIMHAGQPVGEIVLKHIGRTTATLGIALSDNSVKGRGFGTQAILLVIEYARDTLGLWQLEADAVHRNTRSQHVLEKCGFVYIRRDETFKYYRLVPLVAQPHRNPPE